MNEGIPRPLLALAAIVVLAAISLGIKDHFQPSKEAQDMASANPSAASSAAAVPKKIDSAKLRRVRISGLRANPPATAQSATDGIERQSVSVNYTKADAEAFIVNNHAWNTVGLVHAAHDQADATTDSRTRLGKELNAKIVKASLSAPKCVPLPNSVMHGDVDAHYYENWAREYSCQLR